MTSIVRCLSFATFIYAIFSVSGCEIGGPRVQGSGVAKSETREVEGFTRIESAGSANVTVQIGEKQSVVIEADDNILPLIDTIVKGDKLLITSRGSYSTRIDVKVTIVVPVLNEARISGSGDLTASGVAAKDFDAHISGSGDIRISGSTDSLEASISGSGGIDAMELAVAAADVSVTGSGKIKVAAPQSLHAKITGSGDVLYTGKPTRIEKHITGSGSVRSM